MRDRQESAIYLKSACLATNEHASFFKIHQVLGPKLRTHFLFEIQWNLFSILHVLPARWSVSIAKDVSHREIENDGAQWMNDGAQKRYLVNEWRSTSALKALMTQSTKLHHLHSFLISSDRVLDSSWWLPDTNSNVEGCINYISLFSREKYHCMSSCSHYAVHAFSVCFSL